MTKAHAKTVPSSKFSVPEFFLSSEPSGERERGRGREGGREKGADSALSARGMDLKRIDVAPARAVWFVRKLLLLLLLLLAMILLLINYDNVDKDTTAIFPGLNVESW